jgi:hypothetical protein
MKCFPEIGLRQDEVCLFRLVACPELFRGGLETYVRRGSLWRFSCGLIIPQSPTNHDVTPPLREW